MNGSNFTLLGWQHFSSALPQGVMLNNGRESALLRTNLKAVGSSQGKLRSHVQAHTRCYVVGYLSHAEINVEG